MPIAQLPKTEPHCRKCKVASSNVPEFLVKATLHNATNHSLRIQPQTMAFGPGNHYDPSDNTFICPECRTKE